MSLDSAEPPIYILFLLDPTAEFIKHSFLYVTLQRISPRI
jgi:hypothetical protein